MTRHDVEPRLYGLPGPNELVSACFRYSSKRGGVGGCWGRGCVGKWSCVAKERDDNGRSQMEEEPPGGVGCPSRDRLESARRWAGRGCCRPVIMWIWACPAPGLSPAEIRAASSPSSRTGPVVQWKCGKRGQTGMNGGGLSNASWKRLTLRDRGGKRSPFLDS